MNPTRPVSRQCGGESSVDISTNGEHAQVPTEDVHIRSYDHEWSYDLEIEIATLDGTVCFRDRYVLQPNDAKSIENVVSPGDYEICVTLDNDRKDFRTCRIGPSTDATAVIEVGNGIVSLSEGFRTK